MERLSQKEGFRTTVENTMKKNVNNRSRIRTMEKIWMMMMDQTDKEHKE